MLRNSWSGTKSTKLQVKIHITVSNDKMLVSYYALLAAWKGIQTLAGLFVQFQLAKQLQYEKHGQLIVHILKIAR